MGSSIRTTQMEYGMKQEIKEILLKKYTKKELARLRYVYQCLLYEVSKFLLLYVIFSLLHMGHEYLAATVVLLSIRNFSGGIHLNTYWGCFLFTFFFLFGAIAASRMIVFAPVMQNLLLLAGAVILFITGPVTSDNRPKLTRQQDRFYRSIGSAVTFLYFLLFLCEETFTFRNLFFWVIVFQILQLIAAKIHKKGGAHHEENNTECSRITL